MTRFSPAPPEAVAVVEEVRRKHYGDLGGLTLAVLMASADGDIPTIAARPTTAAVRAAGAADVILTIDGPRWDEANPAGRSAMVDHALASLRVVVAKDRDSLDGAGRPKVRRLPMEVEGVGYTTVWRRWRTRSLEHRAATAMRAKAGDLFGDGPEPTSTAPKPKPSPPKPGPRPAA